MIKINIAKDFSEALGGRHYTDGQYSGEEFFDKILDIKFKEAISEDTILEINLDGTYGYPSSFIDQSFGELGRKYGSQYVQDKIKFVSEDQIGLEKIIRNYINGEKVNE